MKYLNLVLVSFRDMIEVYSCLLKPTSRGKLRKLFSPKRYRMARFGFECHRVDYVYCQSHAFNQSNTLMAKILQLSVKLHKTNNLKHKNNLCFWMFI